MQTDWFGILYYIIAICLFVLISLNFFPSEISDYKKHKDRYEAIISEIEILVKDSEEARKVNNLYQKWLSNIQTKVVWRIAFFASVVIGFFLTTFGYSIFVRGYTGLKITAAPPFFFIITSIFCFFILSGILGWLSFHITRTRDEIFLV